MDQQGNTFELHCLAGAIRFSTPSGERRAELRWRDKDAKSESSTRKTC